MIASNVQHSLIKTAKSIVRIISWPIATPSFYSSFLRTEFRYEIPRGSPESGPRLKYRLFKHLVSFSSLSTKGVINNVDEVLLMPLTHLVLQIGT